MQLEPKRKRVLIARIVMCNKPESKRSNHDQAEFPLVRSGGPNRYMLQYVWMNCG